MNNFVEFSRLILSSLSEFFLTPPIVYIFALIILIYICKAIKILIS